MIDEGMIKQASAVTEQHDQHCKSAVLTLGGAAGGALGGAMLGAPVGMGIGGLLRYLKGAEGKDAWNDAAGGILQGGVYGAGVGGLLGGLAGGIAGHEAAGYLSPNVTVVDQPTIQPGQSVSREEQTRRTGVEPAKPSARADGTPVR